MADSSHCRINSLVREQDSQVSLQPLLLLEALVVAALQVMRVERQVALPPSLPSMALARLEEPPPPLQLTAAQLQAQEWWVVLQMPERDHLESLATEAG
ncbi:MAG: hypothetical protein H6908_01395 [Hyphomicrobiales bacterium]|nr:hypothetical protein [Hyphomicrobiales bacterium]